MPAFEAYLRVAPCGTLIVTDTETGLAQATA